MLAELEDLKNFLSLSDVTSEDVPLNLCLLAADNFIKTYCNCELESTRYNHIVSTPDVHYVITPEVPLTAVHGITCFQFTSDDVGLALNLDYVKFYRSGLIYVQEGYIAPRVHLSVQIDYTAGFTSDDREAEVLKWVCMEVAGELYRGRGTLQYSKFDTGAVSFDRFSQTGVLSALSPEVMLVLNMFAKRGPRINS